uniref:Uncharacterized protein n=1 Tax=Romanomermis culicivorax TaxID=13658 RepID=A0A915JE40_ROMCU
MEYNDDNYQSFLDEQTVSRTESNKFIIVDLSGIRYHILKSKIRQYPTTLLYKILDWSKKGKMYYMPKHLIFTPPNIYFFQRSPALFHLILQFYSNGANIHWPQNHCHKEIQDELRFWGVDSWIKFSPCCYDRFTTYNIELDHTWRETGSEMAFHHRISTSGKMDLSPPMNPYKMLVFDSVSIGVVLISTVNFILSTVPELQFCSNDCANNSATFCVGNWSNNSGGAVDEGHEFVNYLPIDARCKGTRVFGYVEAATMIWFTFELIVRFAASSSVRQFFRSPLNIVDVLSVVPYYVEVALWSVQKDSFGLRKARKARTILSFL